MLSSGGARGYAHVGAIKALEERGYHITSVAGASMGALVGGVYCTGKIDELTKWFCQLTKREVLSLIDLSLAKSYVMKGDKLMTTIGKMVKNARIEKLNIPFRAIAADLATQREVVFQKAALNAPFVRPYPCPQCLNP